MITFPPTFPENRLLKRAVGWSMRNRHHIPSLSDLAARKSLQELTEIGRNWQSAGLGTMIEVSQEGHRTVHFSLNDEAVAAVNQLNKRTFMGRMKSVNRSDWFAAAALFVSIIALFKPGS